MDWFREMSPVVFAVAEGVTSMQIGMSPLRDISGEIVGLVGVGRDTSRLRDLEREHEEAKSHVSFLVNYDPLTGLPNRTLLRSRLAEAIAVADRDRGSVAIYVLNVDGFKVLNDQLGYAVGGGVPRAHPTRSGGRT